MGTVESLIERTRSSPPESSRIAAISPFAGEGEGGTVTATKETSSSVATGTAAEGKAGNGMHTVVVLGPAAGAKEDLVEFIISKERCRSRGFKHSCAAVEYSFSESSFQMHLPTSWGKYRYGKKAAGTVSIIYAVDLQLASASTGDEKSKGLLLERIEQILDDFAEMCKLSWVRKCAIIVVCNGMPEAMKEFKGVIDSMKFSTPKEFQEALEFSFRVRCPKFWSAMVFRPITGLSGFDFRSSIRKGHRKMQIELNEARISDGTGSMGTSMDLGSLSISRTSVRASGDFKFLKPEVLVSDEADPLMEMLDAVQRELENRFVGPDMITVECL